GEPTYDRVYLTGDADAEPELNGLDWFECRAGAAIRWSPKFRITIISDTAELHSEVEIMATPVARPCGGPRTPRGVIESGGAVMRQKTSDSSSGEVSINASIVS